MSDGSLAHVFDLASDPIPDADLSSSARILAYLDRVETDRRRARVPAWPGTPVEQRPHATRRAERRHR